VSRLQQRRDIGAWNLVKVHITLNKALRQNHQARDALRAELEEKFGLAHVNMPRFEKLSILTGEVPDDTCIEQVSQIPGVKSAQADSQQHALGK